MGLVPADDTGVGGGALYRLAADCMLFMLSVQDGTVRGSAGYLGSALTNYIIVQLGGGSYTVRSLNPLPPWKIHAIADAGPDQTGYCGSSDTDGQAFELNGGASQFFGHFFEGEFFWRGPFGEVTGENPTVSLGPGTHVVTLSVDDRDDNVYGPFRDTDEVVITARKDNVSPQITVATDPLVLHAHSRGYEEIRLEDFVVGVSDDCADLSRDDVVISNVTSNATTFRPRIVISDDRKSVRLGRGRALGIVRVYTIFVEVIDEAGNSGMASYEVQIAPDPKWLRRK